MFSNEELFQFSKLFTEYQGSFIEAPCFLHVIDKLHIVKLDYIFYENNLPTDPVVIYEDKTKTPGKLYQTRKDFNYGIFIIRTYFDNDQEITEEIEETVKYITEITYLGVSRIKLTTSAVYYLLHDELTGIYNNNYFNRHVTNLIKDNDISEYAALFLNIRNCRYLNAVFGNRITDKMIISLATSLDEMTDSSRGECVARLGGDFFTLIVLKENLEKFTSVLSNFNVEFDFESDHIAYPISLKAGIALLDETYDSFDAIMCSISAAHAVAKVTTAEPPVVYFTQSLIETKFLNDKMVNDLSEDLNASKLFVYYQPYVKVNGDDKKVIGCEALLRWRYEDRMLPASEIIPLAEKSKIILDIDLFVIEKVCSKINEWKANGYNTVPVSINLSEIDLKICNLAPKIIGIINKYNLDCNDITFEFSESAFVHEPVLMRNFVNAIKELGFKIGIEDYTNSFLPYKLFTENAFDYIKVDYKNIDTSNPNLLVILDSIIKLAQSLGIDVIIKGANEQTLIDKSIENGCSVFQSEFFGKALSERFFENKIKNQ